MRYSLILSNEHFSTRKYQQDFIRNYLFKKGYEIYLHLHILQFYIHTEYESVFLYRTIYSTVFN